MEASARTSRTASAKLRYETLQAEFSLPIKDMVPSADDRLCPKTLVLIHTGLQPGGKQTLLRNRFNGFARKSRKPLKRLVVFPCSNTGLKPGVNEKVLLGQSQALTTRRAPRQRFQLWIAHVCL